MAYLPANTDRHDKYYTTLLNATVNLTIQYIQKDLSNPVDHAISDMIEINKVCGELKQSQSTKEAIKEAYNDSCVDSHKQFLRTLKGRRISITLNSGYLTAGQFDFDEEMISIYLPNGSVERFKIKDILSIDCSCDELNKTPTWPPPAPEPVSVEKGGIFVR